MTSYCGELGQNARRVRAFFVNLVDGDNDRDTGGFGVVDGFNCLRHDAVIGGDDQNGNVRDLCAARPHRRKGFMAGRVQKRDFALLAWMFGIVHFHLIRADMLRDAAELARSDFGMTNSVEQRRLAVIHMAHNGHDGRAGDRPGGFLARLGRDHGDFGRRGRGFR